MWKCIKKLLLLEIKWKLVILRHVIEIIIISLVLLREENKGFYGLVFCITCHPPLHHWYLYVKQTV